MGNEERSMFNEICDLLKSINEKLEENNSLIFYMQQIIQGLSDNTQPDSAERW